MNALLVVTSVKLRNVMMDSFSMWCTGWKDEGFSEDENSTSDGNKESLLLAPLIYKFQLRRNDTVFPIAQGALHRREQFKFRKDSAILDGQSSYTNWSSNLEKQMKSLTIASSLIATFAATIQLIEMATESLKTLYTTKPYPIFENLKESISAMTALLDRVIAASVPSYHIADGRGIVFNSSDISKDDENFIQTSLGILSAEKDQHKIDLIKKVLPKLEETLHLMYESLLVGMVVSQVPEMVERGGLSLMASKMTEHALNTTTIVADPKAVVLNIKSGGDTASDPNSEVVVKATVYTQNPYAWSSDSSSYNITSPVVRVDLRDNNGTRELSTLSMTIKRGAKVPLPSLDSFLSNDTRGGPDNLLYHRLSVPSLHSTVVTYIQLPLEMGNVVAYFRSGNAPSLERHNFNIQGELVRSTEMELAVSSDENTTTFKFLVPAGVLKVGVALVGFHVAECNETFAYKYLSFTDSCHVWDENNHKWVPACKMSSASTATETVCTCDNPPGVAFASAFMVPPNTIDFKLVFSKFDPNNASVYGTLIGLLLVWVLGVVWARRQDKKDKEKWLVGYLKDNLVGENYLYLLTVHTGLKRGSGTKSNVSFVLGGSHADSGIRVLSDGKRALETGSVMRYIMATDSCLGHLDYLRIWHDNSGGYQAGWFLNRLDVEDLQMGQRYLFICKRWLAVDKNNGVVDRLVPLAQQDEIMSFDRLFSEYMKIGITDTHLWLSCFLRPAPSTFTRVQRVSCCLVLLLLTMITSAMFYKTEDSETGDSSNSVGMEVKVAFLRFSLTTLWTSSVSIVITSVPMMIFVLIFRNYRPLTGPRAGTKKYLKKELTELTDIPKDSMGINLQTNLLPHYWCYIGWLLLLATAATCAFFLVLYSMQWGITTSEEWLASFVISFFESIFVMDPIKVILLACLLAYCIHNPYTEQPHSEDVTLERVQAEVSMFSARAVDPAALPPDPPPSNVLAQSRKRRLQEQESQLVFFDLLLYIVFVFCVFSLSYGNRDENAFYQNGHLDSLLYTSTCDANFHFDKITKREEVMRWMNETMLPVLFPLRDSLGNSLQLRERVFTSDPSSFRVGPVRVRQLRMPLSERTVTTGKNQFSRRLFCPARKAPILPPLQHGAGGDGDVLCRVETTGFLLLRRKKTKLSRAAWMYQSFEGLSSLPVWGTYSVYSSGGYVMDFSVNWDVISLMLQELEEKIWLDEQTRAVFVEFSLHNPDSNLFSYLRLSAEFPETGDTFLGREIHTFRIYENLQAIGFYMYICKIIAAIGVVILTIKTALKIKQQKLGFFKDLWQVLDVGVVMICYVTVAFYAIKTMKVNESMAAWRDNPKQYVDFYQTAFWDDMYGYSLAAVVFITTIRLLRILGYNRRLTMIAAVLANSGRDLFGFSLVFAIVFVAYLSAGYLVFASTLSEFRSPWESVFALYQLLLGRNVLAAFSEDLALFAWVYFISYVILVFMILMTMFQAIVCGSSTIVRSEVSSVPPPYGLTNLFVKFYHTVIADLLPAWLTRGKSATGLAKVHAQSEGSTSSLGDRKLQFFLSRPIFS
ncbi:hypothetical protein C0Q70_11559 [Pomacea canaliculata]|uniref:PLAT domain-containing protein n=1 Tax=Pomacea canaliculata TaxID=400727 RepID=A0A2T7P6E4_POMCA|nr:hypothetical protein C0Q70_11559 [Pomacea canaliculata]